MEAFISTIYDGSFDANDDVQLLLEAIYFYITKMIIINYENIFT